MVDMNIAKGIARNHRRIELFDAAPIFSASCHPISATDFLPFQLAAHSSGDPQLSTAPHAVHLTGEMGGEFG